MLRDLKLFHRTVAKKPEVEEIENVPLKPTDSLGIQVPNCASRPPLNTIQEPIQNNKSLTEQEVGSRSKIDRTPTKVQIKGANASWALRTPEKQVGFSSRNKFGWIQKNDAGVSANETRDDGKSDVNQLLSSTKGSGLTNGGLTNMTPRSVRSTGRTVTNHSECSSSHSTPTKSVTKPPNTGFASLNSSRPPMSMGVRATNCAALAKGVPISCASPLVVDAVEAPQFELREDPSFWMDHNVQVLIRIRPLNSMERSSHGYNRCLKQESAQTIAWIGQPETRFTFDHVACEAVDQEMLFKVAGLPMVENCLSGYNSCVFAFGQTGSGKTYTMLGEINELEFKPSPGRGMTPRIFEFLFARIRAEEESRKDEKLKYSCKCSFLEIYNEQITDLLDPLSTNLLLREDIKKGVYVENLSEYEVQSVNDILKLLTEGAANRKVAATNMNRESSRSHSVFTCVIESRSEKDSTTNLRFARLNLVDLAGSERQKTSGAEGERLKEAANINKSLSTLGHVIMLLVDVAHGKLRHIPYRDSRLTFLLQESLGGNSKTMIIANVSPSICCAAETLSTLKFAQRAKLIQNNAVINEDASGDVTALQHQIQMLKEELSVYKRRNVSRSLLFRSTSLEDIDGEENDDSPEEMSGMAQDSAGDACQRSESSGIVKVSTKQLKTLEATLAGAFRREQMADTSIKQLEAEIAQLNRLVSQREEDTRCTKMMLKFREDKIQRMESLHVGCIPADAYLQEENNALLEEIQLLRAKIDRNPEVTRFALENIRLLDKLRRFQEFYEEGEREMLLAEVSELRNQLLQYLDGNTEQYNHLTANVPHELEKTSEELERCRNNLSSCLETNTKLTREVNDLYCQLNILKSSNHDQNTNVKTTTESMGAQALETHMHEAVHNEKAKRKHEVILKHTEEIMNLQLELDIFKLVLQEERSLRKEVVGKAFSLSTALEMEKARCSEVSMHCDRLEEKLKDSRSLAEALQSQQILLISELEGLRDNNNHYLELLGKQEEEASALREQICYQDPRKSSPLNSSGKKDSNLQIKLKRMQDSLEKAKKLNTCYQNDQAFQTSNEQEMDEVRRQAEAETAEVIICLQEELITLQQQVKDYEGKEIESKESLLLLENELKELKETLFLMDQDNKRLNELVQNKEDELKTLSEEWEALACDIEGAMTDGHGALEDANDEVRLIASSLPPRNKILEQVGNFLRNISEKELIIEELQRSLEEVQNIKTDMDWKLRSLKGAALAINEVQQQESTQKEKEILQLTSLLREKSSFITELRKEIETRDDQFTRAETCATVAFVIVNRFSEIASEYRDVLEQKDVQISEVMSLNMKKDALYEDQVAANNAAEKQIQTLRKELEVTEGSCLMLKQKLSEEKDKLLNLEKSTEEAKVSWLQKKEVFDLELNDAKVIATQKAAESACLLAKFEEAQETMKEADVIVNTLVTANEFLKLEIERLKEKVVKLINEKDFFTNEVQCLQFSNDKKDQLYASLERQYLSDLSDMRGLVQTMVNAIPEIQTAFKGQFESILDDFNCFKSQILDLTWSSLEDIWSEIIVKDCAVSVMHLCHMGVLLEAANGLNAENGLLHHGLCESNSIIMDLKEHNFKATKELKMFGILKGKLLVDIKNSFDRILGKEDEARKLYSKLSAFEEKILDLQSQEELMLSRSKAMGSELSLLTEELDQHNTNALAVLSDQIKLLMNKEELTRSQVELLTIDLAAKDFESLILTSEFVQMHLLKADLEGKQEALTAFLEDIKKELVVIKVDAALGNHLLLDMEAENFLLKKVAEETEVDRNGLLESLKQCRVRFLEMEEEKEALGQMCFQKADLERKQEAYTALFEDIKKELIFLKVDAALENQLLKETETENFLLKEMIGETNVDRNSLAQSLQECRVRVLEAEQEKEALAQSLKEVGSLNDKLHSELAELMEIKESLSSTIQLLEKEALDQMHLRKADLERIQEKFTAFLEDIQTELIFLNVDVVLENQLLMDTETENSLLKKVVEETNVDRDGLTKSLKQCHVRVLEVEQEKEALAQSLEEVASSNDKLKSDLAEIMETKERLASTIEQLETETAVHVEAVVVKETALQASICELETKLSENDAKLNKLCSIEMENETLKHEVEILRVNCDKVFNELQEKSSVFEASSSRMGQENQRLQEHVSSLEGSISILQYNHDRRIGELETLRKKLSIKMNDLETQTNLLSSLKEENDSLRSNLRSETQKSDALLFMASTHVKSNGDLVDSIDGTWNIISQMLDGKLVTLMEKMFHEICENKERVSVLIMECEYLESLIEELTSENLSFQAELSRKDEISKGLLFDLSLLQESAYSSKDQKYKVEEMVATVESLEDDLALRSAELKEVVIHNQILEAQFQEKLNLISDLELDLSNKCESLNLAMNENTELKSRMGDVSLLKDSVEDELNQKNRVLERLEEEKFQMENALSQMNTFLEGLKSDLDGVTSERDQLQSVVCVLKEKLDTAQAIAEENEARAVEALQTADSTKAYADDKEEEVKLLESSVEELESTVDALENKVDIVKGEAERQRLLREELETELQIIRSQMITVATPDTTLNVGKKNILFGDTELQRHLEEKDRVLRETQGQVEVLEKNIAEKNAEISQCRAHICELNLHAEAQAHEYKQKFKALEAMAEQVKPDPVLSHTTNSSSNKGEKNAAKPRGSGSPFKCIGLGLSQQINSEKEEELTAGRLRIQELESLAASRQKEIFMLNARLAAAESMTHDVIRDLLGVKLDMNNYASLLDHQQVHRIAGKARVHSEESLQEQEVIVKLKQQLNEFAEERQGWLEEINRKQAEMMAAQIASEKLRQQDQFLATENDMLKKENVSHKKKVMELEDEVKKLSGQQNLQQRIHHHAKIKEENNLLKTQNEDLSSKYRRMEMVLSRLKEELTRYRASNGRNPCIDFDEEQQLKNKLKELEEGKLQLTQELLRLCTSILKAAGLTRPASDVSLSKAEEALERLKNRIVLLERETQDLKLKNKICKEEVRLLELKQQPPPLNSRTNDNRTTPERSFQTPFFSCLDR